MTMANLRGAEPCLARYARLVKAGETVTLSGRNKPFAEIRPIGPNAFHPKQRPGMMNGWFPVPANFNAPVQHGMTMS